MELTKGQKKGLDIAVKRFRDREKFTVISGYAGTGKSTLVKVIIEALSDYGIDPDKDVVYTSFTGKATQVLINKGNKNAKTLHKLLYKTFLRADGKYTRTVQPVKEKLVIIDEISMVPKTLIEELFKNRCHVICLGDSFQLPPINPKEDNHLLDNPHIQLTEIMRQEADSEIVQVSSLIRNGDELPYFNGNEVKIISRNQLNTGMMLWADQILCAKNKTRVDINNQMRELLGKEGAPQDGDKIICLTNYWNTFSLDENPLVNGTIGYLKNSYESFERIPKVLRTSKQDIKLVCGDFITDTNDTFLNLSMDMNSFTEGEYALTKRDLYQLTKNLKYKHLIPYELTYGYAITGWKAQGSEWDNVLIFEENFPFDQEEHARFLYTCITRSSKKCVLVRN